MNRSGKIRRNRLQLSRIPRQGESQESGETSTDSALAGIRRGQLSSKETVVPNDLTPLGLVLPILQVVLAILLADSSMEAADGKRFTAPVKVLVQNQPENDTEMQAIPAMQAPVQQPVLPDGRYPQYQLEMSNRTIPTLEEIKNPEIRFLIFLQNRPLLIEARVLIDGQPYGQLREQRIAQLLIDASQPAPKPEIESDSEVEDSENESNTESSKETDSIDPEISDEPEAKSEIEEEEDKPTVNPPTVAEYQIASNATDFLRRYMTSIGTEMEREEVHWLLNNRIDGPVLMKLVENFQHFRASKRPLFYILDRDRDGSISEKEILSAADNLTECDLNRDRVVSYSELNEVAADPRLIPSQLSTERLYAVLDQTLLNDQSMQSLFTRYSKQGKSDFEFDSSADGAITSHDVQDWRTRPADLSFLVEFDQSNAKSSHVTFFNSEEELPDADIEVENSTIRLQIDGQIIEFSALQGTPSDQISIGAIQDGYPILPALDPNSDGRLTIRELRDVVKRLKEFDRDSDGSITASEAQSTIRVCIGLGPTVDSELANIRSLTDGNAIPAVTGPSWFVRMDRNKDNDLMRDEFPGTDEQFATLDADSDELISAQEAIDFDKQKESEPSKDSDMPNEE